MRKIMVFCLILPTLVMAQTATADDAKFSDWSVPVNLGPEINTASMDVCVSVSKNGLSLFLTSNRAGGLGSTDFYVSQRASVNDKWAPAKWLGATINSTSADNCPALGIDEHEFFFRSSRPGGSGGADFYVARRADLQDDFGWGAPQNLGPIINSTANDVTPTFFVDQAGREIMYFASNRSGAEQVYTSVRGADGSFGAAALVPELGVTNTGIVVRRDGLEIIFASSREGSTLAPDGKSVSNDVWVATRNSTAESWSSPVNLRSLNTPYLEGGLMCMSPDGLTLYFTSTREGTYGERDIYMATRTRLK